MAGRKAFHLSEETTRLVNYLAAFDKGVQVSYKDLSKVAGIPIVSESVNLVSARRILQRDHNQVWMPVRPRIGMRRLGDVEIAERLPHHLDGTRRKLKRVGDEASVVEMKQLDLDEQTRFAVSCIQREVVFNALSKASRKVMEKVARGSNTNELPSFTIIEWAMSLFKKDKD
jgi:hypothetical protein